MNAIVIMAKEPEPKKVKTRLVPYLDFDTASRIYLGFLMDRIEQIKKIPKIHHFIAYTPESSRHYFEDTAWEDFKLIPQIGEGLGKRLSNISNILFEKGYKKIVIMDSDSPNLPTNHISTAITNLDNADLVLGPCEDGGYYLVGLSSNIPQVFQGIPWSTSEVTDVTIKKAKSLGMNISLLKKWYDIDTKEDLLRLKNDLERQSKNSNDMYFCENTYKIISKLDIK